MQHEDGQLIVLWNGKPYSFKEDKHNIFLTDLETSVKYKQEVELVFPKDKESTKTAFKQMKLLFSSTLTKIIQDRE